MLYLKGMSTMMFQVSGLLSTHKPQTQNSKTVEAAQTLQAAPDSGVLNLAVPET